MKLGLKRVERNAISCSQIKFTEGVKASGYVKRSYIDRQ
jgi:hypothetical protein